MRYPTCIGHRAYLTFLRTAIAILNHLWISYSLPLLRGGLGWGKKFTAHIGLLYPWHQGVIESFYSKSIWVMNVEPPETLVIIESIVYKSNGFAIYTALCVTKRYSNSSEQNNFWFAYLNIIWLPIPRVFPLFVHFEVWISWAMPLVPTINVLLD